MMKKQPILTERFNDALQYAAQMHVSQLRKGTSVPYVSHLLSVCALVLEDGGDEDQAIAALLHDAVEDQGGENTYEEIRSRFGDRVADIVDGCTDTYETPKPEWKQRKERYIAHLKEASPEILRVSLADKLHNARSILRDLKENGIESLQRFNGGKDGTLWYYRSLVNVFQKKSESAMVPELTFVVDQIHKIVST
jgi:(p)ppGpp synthase/HD superfamily hydrolase